jgi:hypothetical protein
MITSEQDPAAELRAAVLEYRHRDDLGALFDRVRDLAARTAPEALVAAAAEFRDMPEVTIPVYEQVVQAMPGNAQAMVVLANAYWLTGRGADAVQELAERAKAIDPANRGAWHLWSLSESDPRARMERWREVTQRFPQDQLARAALADNAARLAGAERDPLALDLAIATYESLLAEATDPGHRSALEGALGTLREWKL